MSGIAEGELPALPALPLAVSAQSP